MTPGGVRSMLAAGAASGAAVVAGVFAVITRKLKTSAGRRALLATRELARREVLTQLYAGLFVLSGQAIKEVHA
jgi:uncharacterized membrane protein